ncbi:MULTISPECIES: hypothetical protein [Clostridium]|uniref:hypothetical protein n=1 Tax=Clostridium TaxID=1485 RepID=UPI000DFE9590|nr:hypothetical protein [Clostridium sporogenes]MCW6087212.1 hypothetical protein [Clostridium sporogenes]MCW6108655.1 hypothetical protein [Clostridium sporogenes]STC72646.1 Uncharacterised protein [Clostridium botulinum]
MEIIKSSTFQSSVASSVCVLWKVCGCVVDNCGCALNCEMFSSGCGTMYTGRS